MKKELKSISIKTTIFILFAFILSGTIVATSYIPYSNWRQLVNQTTTHTVDSLNEQIISEIDIFIKDAKHLIIMNKGLIEKDSIDINNEVIRDDFFVNALSTFESESIYSFSYGMESGAYYGARKSENNEIEIIRNNEQTQGRSWYYAVEGGRVGEQVLDAGEFDPRTREWYKAAKQTSQLAFSPIYNHFVLDDLVVSASIPIYKEDGDLEGVLGAHINLGRIDDYLASLVCNENACAMIIEKDTGHIVANCSNQPHFKRGENGEIRRLSIEDMEGKTMPEAYRKYLGSGINTYKEECKNGSGNVHIKTMEYFEDGLEWIIITSLNEGVMLAGINNSIKLGLASTILVILVSSYVFFRAMRRYMDPINSLIQTQEDFAKGALFKREEILRYDEIGMLASSFNAMADTIYALINSLEKQVEDRTQELNESKEYFETTLLSVGDGIIATDGQGLITVVNPVIEELTGWSKENIYGRPLEEVLTIVYESTQTADEQPVLISENKKQIPIEYTAAPIKDKDDNTTGVVVVLRDVTEEKRKLDKIKHLSMHDQLTGLYNRWYMEEEIIRLDKQEHLPLTIMVVDVNGLKLVNDAFGHEMGDQLLEVVSTVLKRESRGREVVGRVGGDEFLILLPKTNQDEAEDIKQGILKAVTLEKLESVVISVAVGYTVKESINEDIENIRVSADNQMYKDKLMHGKTMRNQTIETVIRNINFKYDKEQLHTERVSQYCESIARAMGFPEEEVADIKVAGVLHDIGKIVVPPELLNKAEKLTDEEFALIKRHPETGYHILKSVDEYIGLAEDVLTHHENWDGTGYPQGLEGKQIPLNARIIAVADAFEAMTAQRSYQQAKSTDEAIAELKRCAGSQFDPEIVKVFVEDVLG